MIKIRFVTCADAISAGIRAFEYGFWASHAEVVMPEGTLLGAHYDGGVQNRPGDYDAGKFTRELIVPLSVEQSVADKFHAFLRDQLGKPYDTTAILAMLVQRTWTDPDSWFCSELVAAALMHCGWFSSSLAISVDHITPRDLLLILSGRVAIPTE